MNAEGLRCRVAPLAAALLWLWTPSTGLAQQLAIRHYTQADGLPHNQVTSIHQDSKGYLWIGTYEGMSRFDGYRFGNYAVKDGLENFIINTVAEDRRRRLWVGTNGGGVARLLDASDMPEAGEPGRSRRASGAHPKRFVSFRVGDGNANNVNALTFDREHTLWCATDAGLYRARATDLSPPRFEEVLSEPRGVSRIFADSRGRLWFGMIAGGLFQIVDGRPVAETEPSSLGDSRLVAIVEGRDGKLRAANERHVFELLEATNARPSRWQAVPIALEAAQVITALHADADGRLWIGTKSGLIKYDGARQKTYRAREGVRAPEVSAITDDREGNLWFAAGTGGLSQLRGDYVVSYTAAAGLSESDTVKVIEDRGGSIYVATRGGQLFEIVDDRAKAVDGWTAPFSTYGRWMLQSQRGGWWMSNGSGLYHVRRSPLQGGADWRLVRSTSLSSLRLMSQSPGDLPVLIEDTSGYIWLTANEGLHRFRPVAGVPALERVVGLPILVTPLLRDRTGAVWLGNHDSLARFRDGRIIYFEPSEGLPEVRPRAVFVDSRGWLWVGLRFGGVSMTRTPGAEQPQFTNYSTRTGLASDTVWSIAEDDQGRMYFGTGRALDRLDVSTGRIRHFTTADGLAGDLVMSCLKDRAGRIWVATTSGVSRVDPRAERAVGAPPPIFISRIQIAGEELPLPETGTTQVRQFDVQASRNNLLIEYVSPRFQGTATPSYQYRLDNVDRDWSAATDQRVVNYARLAPGSYRFRVRSIDREDTAGVQEATLAFRILPPIWLRGWFIALAASLLLGSALAFHRMRVRQAVAMERIRRQVATDLHDDVGSGLSQVAILSEVLKRRVPGEEDVHSLSEIATLARAMRASMSDIVWAVDPEKDRLADLVQRMRKVASNALEAAGVSVEFRAPDRAIDRIALAPDRRRHVLLIFQELVANIARHACATRVVVDMIVSNNTLTLRVADDGCGFDLSADHAGHGLGSLDRRARELGGRLKIDSRPNTGTTVEVFVPLRSVRL